MADAPSIRRAYLLRLNPGALDEYIEHHDTLPQKWPDMVTEIKRSGIATITTFALDDENLVLVSEIHDEGAWDALWSSPAHDAWNSVMRPLMHFEDDGSLEATPLREIWRYES
jgi:L-rhamnose mutarotase